MPCEEEDLFRAAHEVLCGLVARVDELSSCPGGYPEFRTACRKMLDL